VCPVSQPIPQFPIGEPGRIVGHRDDLGQRPAKSPDLFGRRTEVAQVGEPWVDHTYRPVQSAGALPRGHPGRGGGLRDTLDLVAPWAALVSRRAPLTRAVRARTAWGGSPGTAEGRAVALWAVDSGRPARRGGRM
jgi:hypothetical protein